MPLSSRINILKIRQETGSTTLLASDANTAVEIDNAVATTFTVELNSLANLPIGAQIVLRQTGAGQITIVAGAGVTLEAAGALLITTQQFSVATFYKNTLNTLAVMGDLV